MKHHMAPAFTLREALLYFIGAPTIWIAYFFAVYLSSEQACQRTPETQHLSQVALTMVISGLTIGAGVGLGCMALWIRRAEKRGGSPQESFARSVALSLCWFFGLSLIPMAVPVVWLGPC